MSRHSKWSKVKQFKGAIDAKRSASFTKLAREITVAAREKGIDPNMNVALRVAIDRAKKSSLPKDTIERAIQRGAGKSGEGQIDSLTYEAYAPGGTAMIIECLTDNRNRSANDVKHILSEHSATLATSGSVTYLFDQFGVVRVGAGSHARPASAGKSSGMSAADRSSGMSAADMPEGAGTADMPEGGHGGPPLPDNVELALIDAGASDIVRNEESIDIRCAPSDLAKVTEVVQQLGFNIESSEFEWIPKLLIETNEETGVAVAELIDELDAHDDVSRVYSNLA